MSTTILYAHDIYTADWIRRTYGPIFTAVRRPVPKDFVHPEEHRRRSLIRSHRDTMHFLFDHVTYNLQASDEERIYWYIHQHAHAVCELIAQIRTIRQQVALGLTVSVRETR